jgi:hypothetical protein
VARRNARTTVFARRLTTERHQGGWPAVLIAEHRHRVPALAAVDPITGEPVRGATPASASERPNPR